MSAIDRGLRQCSAVLAMVGGLILTAAALMTGVSIFGRWLADAPLLGDVELMQAACVAAIACFLPYCQLSGAHVRVEFFTQRLTPKARDGLDRAAQFAVAGTMLLLAGRAALGVADMRSAGETSMLLGLPTWLTYLALVPGLLLSGLIALRLAFGRPVSLVHSSDAGSTGNAV